jgi:hypothetical protein
VECVLLKNNGIKSLFVFVSVVAVVFQSDFHSEMHQNDIFLFLKDYFLYQSIKMI